MERSIATTSHFSVTLTNVAKDSEAPAISRDMQPYIPKRDRTKCSICGACMKSPTYLRVHMRCHTDETPYKCARCGVGFQEENTRQVSHDESAQRRRL